MLEERDHLVDYDRGRHALDELCEIVRSLSSHHRGIVVYKLPIMLSQLLLGWRRSACVGCAVQAGRGDFGGEPVGFGKAQNERDEILFNLLLRELLADLVEGFNGLTDS